MNSALVKLREDRFTIYQLLFLVLYSMFLGPLTRDFKRVMQDHDQLTYLGIWGVIAMAGVSWGSIVKSRYLADGVIEPPKIISIFLSFCFLCRIPMLLAGLFVTVTAFTGDGDMSKGINLVLLGVTVFWGIFVVVWPIIQMDKWRAQSNKKNLQKEALADMMLFFGGMFYFTAIWFIIPFEKMAADWPFFDVGQKAEYIIGGLFLYLVVHGTTNAFHYGDRFYSAGSKWKQILFAANILITGIVIIMYPVVFV